jgi:sulfite exporter TauE/SafE
MLLNIIAGISLGLGNGVLCLSSCFPILVPHITAEHHSMKKGFFAALYFSLGRLITYLILGITISYFGNILLTSGTSTVIILILGFILIIYGFAISFGIHVGMSLKLGNYFSSIKSSLLLGLLASFRLCVPFIMALAYVSTVSSIIESIIFIFFFWVASSIYIPLLGMLVGLFSNVLKKQISIERIRRINGIALLIIGLIFVNQGVHLFLAPKS